jgi:hypothetical protein
MKERVTVLERQTTVAPLGVRFRDVLTGDHVGDGLVVNVFPEANASQRARAFPNGAGTYVLHRAPGLRAEENGAGDEAYWASVRARPFVIEVEDAEGRFLPFRLKASLPHRGVLGWAAPADGSPPRAWPSVPVYSAPTRRVPVGASVLRADLWDAAADAPARWAVLEIYEGGQLLGRGVADEGGRLSLIFPYPAPQRFAPGSPPGGLVGSPPAATGPPLSEQVWTLGLRAFYSPRTTAPAPLGDYDVPPFPPYLQDVLRQDEATLWDDLGARRVLPSVPLRFGRDLVLKSRDAAVSSPPTAAARRSALFITPAGSPP